MIFKINDIAFIHNDILSDSTCKDLLQGHSANNSCNWKSSFRCRSECVKLDVPDNQLNITLYVTRSL